MTRRRTTLGLAAVLEVMLIGMTARNSTGWIGSTFPGFFVMENRVVPSIALPQWHLAGNLLFQHEVVAVDGVLAHSSRAIYEQIRSHPPGTSVQYTLRAPDGTLHREMVTSRRFTVADYAALFGAFLVTGSAFLLTALLAFALRPRAAASGGLLSIGAVGGIFILTAVDLYGPHWFFRLHVIAEALVPASLVHLALVFPTDRSRRRHQLLLTGVYLACVVLAGLYELVLNWPAAYSAAHLAATLAQAVGGLVLIGTITYDLLTTRSVLVRRRILVAVLGTVLAFLGPTVLMASSAVLNGRIPINAAALTGFLFPLSFAYAIIKGDLLKADVFARIH